jgi:succinate dehydrogenase / fumarate reductase cytochrome b subunit
MKWLISFFTSSIGRKVIMSLTGLFLCLFLVVHLAGNLQLLKHDDGYAFNTYTYFMTHNPLIKFISYFTYFFILLHAVQGVMLSIYNRRAKGKAYAVKTNANASLASKNMALLGILILAFLIMHMGDFWLKMKMGALSMVSYEGYDHEIINLFERVGAAFEIPWMIIVYVLGQIILAFHLWHGFESAFQTLGINHKKYTPIIKLVGRLYSILIPVGFAIIPIIYFFS